MVFVTTTTWLFTVCWTTSLVTETTCCGVVLRLPTSWALLRIAWIAVITPFWLFINASPRSLVQSMSSFILLSTSGKRANACTFGSHGWESIFGMLLVSLMNRAAFTMSSGYAEAGSNVASSGSGYNAIGATSFSRSAWDSCEGADGG